MGRKRKQQLTPEDLIRQAEELMAEARRLAAEQGGDAQPTLDEGLVKEEDVIGDAVPIDDDVKAERDPLEMFDMSRELEQVRRLLQQAGYARGPQDANSEVWAKPGPNGMRGHTAYLLSDVNRRIRLEIRDPLGGIQTNVSPAWPIDVAIALGLGREAVQPTP